MRTRTGDSITIDNRDMAETVMFLEARVDALTIENRKLVEFIREQRELEADILRRIVE